MFMLALLILHFKSSYFAQGSPWSGRNNSELKMECKVLASVLSAIPTMNVALFVDDDQDAEWLNAVGHQLFHAGILTAVYSLHPELSNITYLQLFAEDIKNRISGNLDTVYVFNVDSNAAENILQLVLTENYIRRNILLIFLWRDIKVSHRFRTFLQEGVRICVVINKRYGVFQILYNHARADGGKNLDSVNWWSNIDGMYHSPLLPSIIKTYKNFDGRLFRVPVLHKPPWNFVTYSNTSNKISIRGGRDDKLLRLLSNKLNFDYEYFDPPDRSQGSTIVNGTMQGVLGLIWQREVEMFIGDLTVTYERSLAVEFSFLTLTDSEVFLTHSPGRLNEALALVRPFQWQVWPAVLTTVVLAGPFLYALIWSSNRWEDPTESNLSDCIWITSTIFLRQSISKTYRSSRVRLLIVLLYLVSTYVIGDMYSANLTSMLARPARERPISNLEQLYQAMKFNNFQLLVEKNSASHTVLENSTGLYQNIWEKMRNQAVSLIESTEEGMLLVRDQKNIALMGGRETFLYDSRRFGAHYFHLSEKLYTRYSAIALQIGCPFVHNFNDILMRLFEVGVLTKITQEEYRKLEDIRPNNEVKKDVGEGKIQPESEKDQRMTGSMEMLQGAFLLLITGYIVAGIILINEYCIEKYFSKKKKCTL